MTAPVIVANPCLAASPVGGFYRRHGKRLFDLIFVAAIAPVVLPLLVLILLLTWVLGRKAGLSPLFSQYRVGRGGKVFRCWKVRTMVAGADQLLADLIARCPETAKEWRERQKLANDPRITGFGRFLRRTSLDELPQLWNVLNGTMSLIGPRPFLPNQRALYSTGQTAPYYSLLPGLSGPWQISGRDVSSFSDRRHFDDAYAASLGARSDLRILLRTFVVVLRGTGS
ncbi:MAG: sugar transferase [Paracoccaceae bacterium]